MSYELKPTRHSFGSFDFGGGADEQFAVVGPKGKKGILVDYGVDGVTELFAGSSSTPMLAVGTAADQDAYGEEFDLGALAVNTGKSVNSTYNSNDRSAIDAVIVDKHLPADTAVILRGIASVGTPTGMATPWMDIIWAD